MHDPRPRPPLTRLTCAAILLHCVVAFADTPAPTVEQYQDALNQLKAAQDRKNELATENQKLKDRVADLEKQAVEPAYFLRQHYATWQAFIAANPRVKAMWTAFFPTPPEADLARDLLGDGQWPFSA